ncbi:hypothetical protein V461_00285 [Pantoea ananatis BRT98]|nr:hypothetical protein V461_00285 [Pantoea ananatis BRT98]
MKFPFHQGCIFSREPADSCQEKNNEQLIVN